MLTNSTTTKILKLNSFKQASKAFKGHREGHTNHNNNKRLTERLNGSSGFNKRTMGIWE